MIAFSIASRPDSENVKHEIGIGKVVPMRGDRRRADYEEALREYDEVISACTAISQGAEGIFTESRKHYYASVLFTKLCVSGVSLLQLCPGNRLSMAKFEHWDYSSVGAIARSIIDCSHMYYYLCIDSVSQDEWECRWDICNLHDCLRRHKMFSSMEVLDDADSFTRTAIELREWLSKSNFFATLPRRIQKECLKGSRLFLETRGAMYKGLELDPNFYRGYYIFLSCNMHSYPIGFYRIGMHGRGRGLESPAELDHMRTALVISMDVIKKIGRHMLDLFPVARGNVSPAGLQSVYRITDFG
jgi:hypothetical protein